MIGEISGLITAFLWSITSIAFANAAERIGSMQLNISRLIFACIYLVVTILIFNFSLNLTTNQFIYLSISGIIGLVIGDSFLFNSYKHIGARLSMLLMAAAPAMGAILAFIFLGESLTLLSVVGMIITISGIALVIVKRDEHPTSKYKISKIGILFGLMSALGQAAGLIFAKFAFNEGPINGFSATFVRIFASIIILIPIGLLSRRFKNPVKVYAADKKALGYTILGSIVGPYLGITFSLIAVANTEVGIASTLMSTVPVIMLPMVRFVYKEKLNWQAVLGSIMSVGGIAILFLK